MEATFMVMTGKYYLTEDESILLGSLKMQAESGDFNPDLHDINNIKQRVSARFPHPVNLKMQNLISTQGISAANNLAERIQNIYARLAGN